MASDNGAVTFSSAGSWGPGVFLRGAQRSCLENNVKDAESDVRVSLGGETHG
jgi:hypothetical protein